MTYPALPPDLLKYRIASPLDDLITFNGDPDENGVEYLMARLDGWDSPDVRVDATNRAVDHGQITGSFFYGGRQLTALGTLHSPAGIDALRLARERLLAAVDTPHDFCTVYVDEDPARLVLARRAGRVAITMHGKHYLEFNIALLAPDPRRYAQDITAVIPITTGTGTATTPGGTFSDGTPMELTLTPPGSGSGVTASVHEATTGFDFAITGHREVVIDSGEKTVTFTDDGSPAWSAVDVAGELFLNLLPGVEYQFKRTAGDDATVRYRDAWI